jgi:curved DNA-binding protein
MKGKGIPGTPAGNLYAVLEVVLPPAVSETEKDAFRSLAKSFDFDARANLKG